MQRNERGVLAEVGLREGIDGKDGLIELGGLIKRVRLTQRGGLTKIISKDGPIEIQYIG